MPFQNTCGKRTNGKKDLPFVFRQRKTKDGNLSSRSANDMCTGLLKSRIKR